MRKIATKVLKQINKANARKVIDLNEYRQQKKATEDLFKQIITTETAIKTGHDPLHAVYIHTQNLLSILVEALQAIPELSLIFREFGEFHVNSSGEILGEYVLRLSKYTSQQEQHEALAAGYRRHIDGSMSIEGELKGQRYSSNGIQANTDAQRLNRTYLMPVVEEPSKLVVSSKALLTPIYQGAGGVLLFLAFVAAGGLNSTVAISLEVIHICLFLF